MRSVVGLGDVLGANVAELVGSFVLQLAVLHHALCSHLNLQLPKRLCLLGKNQEHILKYFNNLMHLWHFMPFK
jgi:hypothetical protein